MKHLLNNMSEEEKNSIREQHAGGMKIYNEKFKFLVETKQGEVKPYLNESSAQALIDNVKKQMASGVKPDPKIQQQIKDCITSKQLTGLMFFTTSTGAYLLGVISVLLASGAGTMLGGGLLAMTAAIMLLIESLPEDQGGLGVNLEKDVKSLLSCMGYK